MLKFMNKNKGAISIFLVIVLLPILSVASIFVDMSRINLGNAMAKSLKNSVYYKCLYK